MSTEERVSGRPTPQQANVPRNGAEQDPGPEAVSAETPEDGMSAPERLREDFERHDPAAGRPPPQRAASVVVPRWVQVAAVVLGALGAYALARAASRVVLIFVVAAVIALILNPLVAFLQRRRLPRRVAVLAVYVTFFLTLAGLGTLVATPISNQVKSFKRDIPSIVHSANQSLARAQTFFDKKGVHVQIVKPGKTALQTLQDRVSKGSSTLVSFTGGLLRTIVSTSFNLVLIFVLSVYMLIYGETIGSLVRTIMPAGDGSPEDDYPLRVQRAVSGFVRGQLLFSLAMGTSAGLGLWIYGLLGIFPTGGSYAVGFGVFYALMELVPFVGPVLGALPPVLIALFQDPLSAVWVVLLFVGLQQLEGHVVAPQIFGHALRINPLLVIFALTLGGEIYGLIGALIALPIAAVLRETTMYLHRHLVLEPWDTRRPIPPA